MIYKSRYLDIVLIIISFYSVFFIIHKFIDGKIPFWDFHVYYCSAKNFFLGNSPYGLDVLRNCLNPNITLTANFSPGTLEILKYLGYLNISTAKIILDKNKLKFNIQFTPSDKYDTIGMVTHVNPYPGKIVKKGTIIDLKVLGPKESYFVPDLRFKNKNIALNILKSMGLIIDTVIYDYSDVICTYPSSIDLNKSLDQIMDECTNYEVNTVWNQTPVFGEKVFKDEGIKLFVSKGEFAPELYDVPILIDLNLGEAIKIINKSGLLLGEIKYVNANLDKNKVIDQSTYDKCRINSKINLTVQK